MGARFGRAGNRPAERGDGAQGRCGNAHRAAVRCDEPHPVALAYPLLRHPAGSLLLDRRPLHRRRQDVDRTMASDRSPPHRAAAVPGAARTREAMSQARSSRQRYRGFVQDYKQRRLDDAAEPGDSPRPARGERRAYVREYLRWLRPYRYAALALLVLALLTTGLQMIEPLFMRFIIDRVLLNVGLDTASRLARLQLAGAAFVAVVVLSNVIDAVRDYRQRLLNVRVMMSLRRSLFERLLHLPLSRLWDMKTGGILSRLTGDVETTTGLLQMALVSPVVSLIRLSVAVAVLLVLNWRLALTAMAVVPGAMLISFMAARRIRPIYRSLRRDVEHIDGRVGETFSGIRIVRAFRRELQELLNYMRGRHTVLRKELFAHRRELVVWTPCCAAPAPGSPRVRTWWRGFTTPRGAASCSMAATSGTSASGPIATYWPSSNRTCSCSTDRCGRTSPTAAATRPTPRSRTPPGAPMLTSSSPGYRSSTRHRSASGASSSRAASSSAWPLPERFSHHRRSSSWTSRRATWTQMANSSFRPPWLRSWPAAPRS